MRASDPSQAGWRRRRTRYAGALTPRQHDVLELLVTGLTNEEIAEHLGITAHGVKYHVAEILQRLGVDSRHDAVALHLGTQRNGRLAAWAPVMLLRKLPFAWLPKVSAGVALTAAAVGIALLAWGVISTSSDAVTTTGCSAEQSVGSAPPCAPGVAPAEAGAAAITAISAGGSDTCALKDGGVWCWGGYFISILDDVSAGTLVPVAVPGLESGVSAISVGGSDACAVKDGRVWCWQQIFNVSLSTGAKLSSPVAVVPGLERGVTAISPSCALKDGGAWCRDWPTDSDSAVFVAVPELASGVSAISAGNTPGDHNRTCGLKDGGAWCWGSNWGSPLGNQSTTRRVVPVTVSGLGSGVNAISVGDDHVCAVKDGGIWCWGSNFARQLGNNGADSAVPVAVSGLTSGVGAISAGGGYSCALKDGGVWCWGDNSKGQLGNSNTTDVCGLNFFPCSHVPVAVPGLPSGVSAISTGSAHSCALKDDGVWCWGSNSSGQLGDNGTTDSAVPVAVLFPPPSAGDIAAAPGGQPSPTPPSASDIAAAPGGQQSPTPPSVGDIAAAPGGQPSPTPPSVGDIAAQPVTKLPPSQTSTDSAGHRAAYVLAATAAAALAIVAAGMWAMRRRRSSKTSSR